MSGVGAMMRVCDVRAVEDLNPGRLYCSETLAIPDCAPARLVALLGASLVVVGFAELGFIDFLGIWIMPALLAEVAVLFFLFFGLWRRLHHALIGWSILFY